MCSERRPGFRGQAKTRRHSILKDLEDYHASSLATGYNVVAIPLAAGALYAWGLLLTPALGAVLMSASTVIVALDARLLTLKS